MNIFFSFSDEVLRLTLKNNSIVLDSKPEKVKNIVAKWKLKYSYENSV